VINYYNLNSTKEHKDRKIEKYKGTKVQRTYTQQIGNVKVVNILKNMPTTKCNKV